jgi:DNA-binding HxlR family transcriptional regulator
VKKKPIPYTSETCPITSTIRVMGRRWKPLTLYFLRHGELRFSELRRHIPEATQKMLTQTLRELEADGLILRTVHEQVPPKVSYAMTPYGLTLEPILKAMCKWGDEHGKRTVRKQESIDLLHAKKRKRLSKKRGIMGE